MKPIYEHNGWTIRDFDAVLAGRGDGGAYRNIENKFIAIYHIKCIDYTTESRGITSVRNNDSIFYLCTKCHQVVPNEVLLMAYLMDRPIAYEFAKGTQLLEIKESLPQYSDIVRISKFKW